MSDANAMLEMLKAMYCNAPKTDQEINDEVDRMAKQFGITCKACGKEINSKNCDEHWFFRCNPDYVPQPIKSALEEK